MTPGDDQVSVAAPVLKVVTAWGAVGITSWADAASFLAALYTFFLLCEWLWKRFIAPFCEARGWIRRARRRKGDCE